MADEKETGSQPSIKEIPEIQEEEDLVQRIELLKKESILSQPSKPSIELILDDVPEPTKDVNAGRRSLSPEAAEIRLRAVKFMNSYRLDSKQPFSVEKVCGVLEEVLQRELRQAVYEPGSAMRTCVALAAEIRARVKTFKFDRYKIICLVSIVEKKMQSVHSMAKFLWDTERDRHASFMFSNAHLASMACVFGIYYE